MSNYAYLTDSDDHYGFYAHVDSYVDDDDTSVVVSEDYDSDPYGVDDDDALFVFSFEEWDTDDDDDVDSGFDMSSFINDGE